MFDNMCKDCQAQGKPGTLASFGENPGGVILGYVSQAAARRRWCSISTPPTKKIANDAREMIMAY